MLYAEREGERIPLSWIYAEALAEWLGYGTRIDDPPTHKHWFLPERTPPKRKGHYSPKVEATPVEFAVFDGPSMLRVYLVDAGAIHCGMVGEAWDEDRLFALLGQISHLPHAAEVREVVLAKADWLDANPMYRGLPTSLKSAKAHKVHVDQLET